MAIITASFIACHQNKISQSVNMKQGIEGYVYRISGNQMPQPGIEPPPPPPFSTTVYIYEATNISEVIRVKQSAYYRSINKKLITTVQSDSTGHFAVELPVGSYSLFTKVKDLFYANMFDMYNNIALVKVDSAKTTAATIKVDAGAIY